MDNQHRKIKTYRELNATEIALMNEVKNLEAVTEQLIHKIRDHIYTQRAIALQIIEFKNPSDSVSLAQALEAENTIDRIDNKAEALRWVDLSRTNLQVGFMELVRSVAQPVQDCTAQLPKPPKPFIKKD